MIALYATLRDVRRELEIHDDAPVNAGEDEVIVDELLPYVSARIEKHTGTVFAPIRRTSKFNAYGFHIDDLYNALDVGWLPVDSIAALTIGGEVVAAEDYFFLESAPPYRNIALGEGAGVRWDTRNGGDWRNSILVDGIWTYPGSWNASGQTVQDNPLSSSAGQITVVSSTAFSPGQMLQIESEWSFVLAVPDATHINVQRGVRGSTAAAHNQNAPISIWRPEPQIVRAAARWAAFLYKRRARFSTIQRSEIGNAVVENVPADMPEEIATILSLFTFGVSAGE